MDDLIIDMQNVAKTYGETEALRNIDLQVLRGDFLTLLGPSGCGKTTLLLLYASIEKLDTRLLEAAQDLGAGRARTFVSIVLPLTLPGIVAGSMLVFLPALGMFYIPDLLGGAKTLLVGNLIKNQFLSARDWPFGSAVSVMLTVLMAAMLLVYGWTARTAKKRLL
jgi:spermidine/putrescine transport system permease protein